jgi:hypothetical protein
LKPGPEEIPDAEHELVLERVCVIDVAKGQRQGVRAAAQPSKPGRRVSRVWDVAASTRDIAELADQRVAARIENVTVESTSDYWLLEDASIKVSAVASTMDTLSVRDILEALITGQRDPKRLAGLARGQMKIKHAALVEALTGRFDDHLPNWRGCCWTGSTRSPPRSPPSPPASTS